MLKNADEKSKYELNVENLILPSEILNTPINSIVIKLKINFILFIGGLY
jgi:hypothetical protein